MVCLMLVTSKTLIPFIRLSNYAFTRDDITYCKCVPNTTYPMGKLFNILKELLHNKILEISLKL